jgi:hypothetical protein
MESLADFLGTNLPDPPFEAHKLCLEDITDSKAFALAVLDSREFRQYIVSGLTLGNLPGFASILGKLMDHAWGKPPERVEHTGKDGKPIETITEVRRVIVRADRDATYDRFDEPGRDEHKPTTH